MKIVELPKLSAALLLILLVSSSPGLAESAGEIDGSATRDTVRFGFSSKIFKDVNEADGLAAVQVWSENFAENNEMALLVESTIFRRLDSIKQALVEDEIDLVNITMAEFRTLRPYLCSEPVYLSAVGEDARVDYLLLVKADNPAMELYELEGGSLLILENLQTRIAPDWLDSHLRGTGLPGVRDFFGQVNMSTKTARAILPVFFGKTDACLVNRHAYEMAKELNPQLDSALRVVCRSPLLIPGATFFRSSFPKAIQEKITDHIVNLHKDPQGAQVLLLFKTQRVEPGSFSDLEDTLRVIGGSQFGMDP